MFGKILVAFDNSPQAQKALATAIEWAEMSPQTTVKVLHVVKYPAYVFGEAFIVASTQTREMIYEDSLRIVNLVKQQLDDKGVNGSVEMLEGDPAETVVSYAKNHHYDVIMLGSRGLTGVKEWMLGSVSHYIVQHATVPVFVVK